MAHMTHEEESAIDLNGNSYIIDFSAMQQVGKCHNHYYTSQHNNIPPISILLVIIL
jgi:hypothetical protein